MAAAVRLLHRRRGWNVTAIWSLIASLIIYGAYLQTQSDGDGGTAPSVVAFIAIACAVLFVVAVVCYAMDGAALKRQPPAVVAQATAAVKHRPVHHHPYLHTAVGKVAFGLLCLGMVLFLFVAVIAVPGVVNGVAYLTGTGGTATFVPQSYGQACGSYRVGCTPDTDGILEYHGTSASSTWPDVVPLGQPFHVREPLWTWGLGAALINNDGIAIAAICISLLLIGVGILILYLFYRMVRTWRRRRRRAAAALTAVAEVGGRDWLVRDAVEYRGAPLAGG